MGNKPSLERSAVESISFLELSTDDPVPIAMEAVAVETGKEASTMRVLVRVLSPLRTSSAGFIYSGSAFTPVLGLAFPRAVFFLWKPVIYILAAG